MKIRLNFLHILGALLMLSAVSCKKDGTLVVASPSSPVNLTASQQTIVLSEGNATENAVDLSWNKADFGYAAAINYTLQVSFRDSAFHKFSSVGVGAANALSFTVADLNTLLLGAKYEAGTEGDVMLRVLAQVADSLYAFSDTLILKVTPYVAKRVISYSALYVPGAYQGWMPASEVIARLFSVADNGVYEGYVNLPDATNEFKFTAEPNWDGAQYASGGAGLLATSGDNLKVEGAGYYLMKADTKKLTWDATPEDWGIIGDAAKGWGDADDILFDFDAENQVLTKTVTLKAGNLKFRANHKWDLNIGVNAKYGGDNIVITEAGIYKITLDLRVPSEPVVTMALQ